MLFKSVIFNMHIFNGIKGVSNHHQMLHSDNLVPRYCGYKSRLLPSVNSTRQIASTRATNTFQK
jgi:hypothetical protein